MHLTVGAVTPTVSCSAAWRSTLACASTLGFGRRALLSGGECTRRRCRMVFVAMLRQLPAPTLRSIPDYYGRKTTRSVRDKICAPHMA